MRTNVAGDGVGCNLQLLEASELGSEAALGGCVDNENDLALVLGQRLVTALFCVAEGN